MGMVEFYCIIGRDGMNTSDWTVEADNTRNCAPLSADPLSANVPANMQQGQPPRPDHGHKLLKKAGFKDSEIAAAYGEHYHHSNAFKNQLVISLIAAGVVVFVGILVAMWETVRRSKHKGNQQWTLCTVLSSIWRYIEILSTSELRYSPTPSESPHEESAPLIGGSGRYGMC